MTGQSSWTEELVTPLEENGFPAWGLVDLDEISPTLLSGVSEHYKTWLDKGYSGEMSYLVRGRNRRDNLKLLFPEVRSVLCVLYPYPAGNADDLGGKPKFAKYIKGPDYHLEVKSRLEKSLQAVSAKNSLQWKVCVDTSAVYERFWATQTGLGWIGKNSMLIHPQLGSHVFIGVALLNRASGEKPKVLPDFCGPCVRCIRSCPTNCIQRDRTVDSRRCISYLTIEHRGVFGRSSLDSGTGDRAPPLNGWVAGCDDCQDVCPFNSKSEKKWDAVGVKSGPHATWYELLQETETDYLARIKGTAQDRIKFLDFRRNLLVALGQQLTQSKSKFSEVDFERLARHFVCDADGKFQVPEMVSSENKVR